MPNRAARVKAPGTDVTWQLAASVLGKSKSIPWATSGFAEHAAPSKKLNGKKLPEQERPGWLARLIRVHHLAGKRLGSEVPADPLISIGGRSHDQREVLQLPLQHAD